MTNVVQFLGNVNASTQDMETKMYNSWYCTMDCIKEKDLWLPIGANIKVSEQCGIAASKGNHITGLMR